MATFTRTKTDFGWVYTVLLDGAVIFQTLDDCFGKDRLREWSRRNKITIDKLGEV